ncbi:hypothetical protein BASA81_000382 [Batrachochytrium salamandrivorans]|nr:hypothetical protein BASA81_000382 [Batrachochytrium salamandrivorans]
MQAFLNPDLAEGEEEEEENQRDLGDLESVVSTWEMVDFPHVQNSIEDQVEQLVNMEESRREQRKDLAAKTKEFRSLPGLESVEVKTRVMDLIKLYQQAYETVSTEAKFGSAALLTLYKLMRHLPNPASLEMKQTLANLLHLQQRNQVLETREESLTSALRTAREKNRGMDELKQERERFQIKIQLDSEAMLESERMKNQEVLTLQMSKFEEESGRLQIQLDYVGEEIERLRLRNNELEQQAQHRNPVQSRAKLADELQQQLEAARTEGFASAQQQFLARITLLTEENEKVSRKFLSQIDMLQSHLSQSMEQISELKSELGSRPSTHEFETLKNQLAVISRLQQQPSSSLPLPSSVHSSFVGMDEDSVSSPEYLDGLSSFLLATNQRLVAELQQAKDQVAQSLIMEASDGGGLRSASPALVVVEDDVTINSSALKAQRDRLRAKLEKRDLEIEQFTNKVEAQDSAYRRLMEDTDKLRQRLKFLQSYKVGEKSTLLSGLEQGQLLEDHSIKPVTLGLGQGVGHQFRNFYDARSAAALTRKQQAAVLIGGIYIVLLHVWMVVIKAS